MAVFLPFAFWKSTKCSCLYKHFFGVGILDNPRRIIVTGASGFIAKHVIAQLLDKEFSVRATLRDFSKAESVRRTIDLMCANGISGRFDLVSCDLLSDDGWLETMEGGDALMHLAAIVPSSEPKNPATVIRPSLEGAERVLGFALAAGIRRVVMTSSIAAIGYGHKSQSKSVNFTSEDWTVVEGLKGKWAYPKAKTLAEKRAWEIAGNKRLDLTCICPSMVLGPVPDRDISASLEIVKRLMNGKVPAIPPGGISFVDVRDVAQIHVAALDQDSTINQRIIASAGYVRFSEIAKIIKNSYPDAKLPTGIAPIWLLKFLGNFSRTISQVAADLDVVRNYDGSAGSQLLQGEYRGAAQAILSSAESLIELGLVRSQTL